MRFQLIFSYLIVLSCFASAGSYYLSPSGDDDNDGTSTDAAWADIQLSINKLSSIHNDTLYILPGTYPVTETIFIPPGINVFGYSENPEEVIIEFNGDALPVLVSLKSPVTKSWPGSNFPDGNQTIKNISLKGHKKVTKGIVCERRNHVKFKNLHVYDFIETGIVLAAYEKDYLNKFDKEKIVGAELSGCVVKECSRLIPNSDYLYTSCVSIGGWYGGSMHHNYIFDQEGDDTQSGQALIAMGMTMAKVHDNTMLINNEIRNHWGGVFSVLTGYTSAFEFYNNTVNSGISCEHRIDEEHIITPNALNIYIHHNYFYLDSEEFKGVQAIELYVDNAEISHNYFENVNGITSWQGKDTLKNVFIHHNIFRGPGFKSGIKLTMGGNSSTKGFSVYENFKIYNNIFDNYDIGIENYYGKTKDFEIKNNVFLNLNDQVWYHHNHQTPENIVFDHNLAYNHTSLQNDNSADFNNTLENIDPGLKLSGDIPGEWYQASGSESNVVNAGLVIDPYTLGFGGSAPDLGAFEFNGIAPERLIAPVLSKQPGEYYDHVEMIISDSNDVATIYYTLDGSIPDAENGILYTSPFNIDKSATLKAICYQNNMLPSYVVSNDFYIYEQKVATPAFAVEPGEYNSPVAVKIESETNDATIIYTTDGTMPSASNGTVYKAPVYLNQSENIHAKAFKDGMIASDLVSADYVIEYAGFGEGTIVNNDHDSIRYSDHFWNHLSDQEEDYLQDVHTCFSQGSYFEYEFTGTGILYLAPRKKDLAEEIEIYMDDELFTVLSLYQQDEVHQDTVFAYSRLPHGKHKIKVVKSSLTGSIALDALVILNNPTSVKDLQHSLTIDVYPNPVKDNLYVQFSGQQADVAVIEIYSMGGEQLLQKRYLVDQYENTIPLDIAKLSSGMYIVGITLDDKQSFRKITLE